MGFSGLFKDALLELHPDGVSVLLSTAILTTGAEEGTCSWGSLSLTLARGDSRFSLNSGWGWNMPNRQYLGIAFKCTWVYYAQKLSVLWKNLKLSRAAVS